MKKIKKTVIILGYECNNRCVFCYNDAKRRAFPERTTSEIKAEMLSAKARGTTYIELIGGEPTIRRDIFSIIEFARDLGFQTVMFATNGRMFYYSDFVRKILDAGVTDLVFSIHGHTPELHDSLTGCNGSFAQLVRGIENLREHGFRNIGSNTTIVKQNYRHLPNIGRFIFGLGIRNSEFIFVDPTRGPPQERFHEFVPKVSDAAEYIRRCLDIGRGKAVHWAARYFPACYITDHLDQLSELQETAKFSTEHVAPDFVNMDVEGSRKVVGRIKTGKCDGCRFFGVCEGLWKEYVRNYGDSELKPMKGEPIRVEDIIG